MLIDMTKLDYCSSQNTVFQWECHLFQTFSKNCFSEISETQYLKISLAEKSKLSPNTIQERFGRQYI